MPSYWIPLSVMVMIGDGVSPATMMQSSVGGTITSAGLVPGGGSVSATVVGGAVDVDAAACTVPATELDVTAVGKTVVWATAALVVDPAIDVAAFWSLPLEHPAAVTSPTANINT